MKTYIVQGYRKIAVPAEVYVKANSQQEALEKAQDLGLQMAPQITEGNKAGTWVEVTKDEV